MTPSTPPGQTVETSTQTPAQNPMTTARRGTDAPPAIASDIVMMDADALAAAIRGRDVSCVEVMAAYLDHIDVHNGPFNAIVGLRSREDLLAEAGRCDQIMTDGGETGLLFGFPQAPKDLQPVRGLVSTSGSPIFKSFTPTDDSLVVQRMRQAGAIFIGKTNTPEFGLGSNTFNPVYGATRNAFDPTKTAGGSSGGAAVALALRMLPVADGSDYGGSLRNPAGWNNVYGFRTSFGVVPAAGEDVWTPTMGVAGPMARTVRDLVRLLAVQSGFSPRAPLSTPAGAAFNVEALRADVAGKRIAWLGDFSGFTPYEDGVLDHCEAALGAFKDLGCEVEAATVDFPLQSAWEAFVRLRWWQQGGALHRHYANEDTRALMKPEAVWEVEGGLGLKAFDVTAASIVRTAWSNAFAKLFERFDYAVAPTAQTFPFDVATPWPTRIGGREMKTYHEWMTAACLVTMTGHPALAAPAGFTSAGAPMGLQIIGPARGEADCLTLALAYDDATQWSERVLPPALRSPQPRPEPLT